jgi:hypothetical protein
VARYKTHPGGGILERPQWEVGSLAVWVLNALQQAPDDAWGYSPDRVIICRILKEKEIISNQK